MGYLYDYNLKAPATDKCVRYTYYIPAANTATIARGTNNADFVWNCEACQSGYWLVEDTSSATETNTPLRRYCS